MLDDACPGCGALYPSLLRRLLRRAAAHGAGCPFEELPLRHTAGLDPRSADLLLRHHQARNPGRPEAGS